MKPRYDELPAGVEATILPDGTLRPSGELTDLLVCSRSGYRWPLDTTPLLSQQVVIRLEQDIAHLMECLSQAAAHEIVTRVSEWAGNNSKAHSSVVNALSGERQKMSEALLLLAGETDPSDALDVLSNLGGIGLVIASKVYRFCCPATAAAVDRHASYFFNSLDVVLPDGNRDKALRFRREWANSRGISRLAAYSASGYAWNRTHYVEVYLPILAQLAQSLNASDSLFTCAVTGERRAWRPADVEMAAYRWWAQHGAR